MKVVVETSTKKESCLKVFFFWSCQYIHKKSIQISKYCFIIGRHSDFLLADMTRKKKLLWNSLKSALFGCHIDPAEQQGAEFWISCKRLSNYSRLQLIQNLASMWHPNFWSTLQRHILFNLFIHRILELHTDRYI